MTEIIEVLKIFYDKVSEEEIFWILSGSTSLYIQGVNIKPNDIDIITDKEGAKSLGKILSEYCIEKPEYSSTEEYRSYYGQYIINGVKVDLVGNFQYRMKDGSWSDLKHKERYFEKEYGGMLLKLLPLEKELDEYEELGREDKVRRIKKRLGV